MSGPYPNNTPGSFVFVDRNMPHHHQDTFSPSRSETPSPPKATHNTLHPRTSSGSNSTRGPSNRYRRDRERVHSNTPTDALLTLLINEEHEAKEARKLLHTALSQLDSTSNRLAQAESDGRLDSLQGIKFAQSVLDARNEATRAQQELGLYKMQLENAQREVQRAKEVVRTVEAQRDEAERDAAKARTLARRLKEERVMFVAREEGRREGFEEGLRQGRLIALAREEERMVGYRQMRRIADRPADETAYIEEEGDDAAYSDVVHSRDERRPAHDIRGRPLSIEGGTRGVYDTPRRPASADLANHSRSRSMNTPRAPEPTLPRTRHHRTASASTAETPRRAESTPPQHQHQYPPTPDLESELDRTTAPHPPFTIPEPLTYLPMPAPPPPPPILIPVPVPMPPPAPTQTQQDQGQRRIDTHVITRRTSSPDTRSPSSSTTGLSQLDLVTFPNPSGGSGSGRGRRGNGNGNSSNINGSGSGARGLDRDREGQRGRDRVRSLSAIPEDGGSVRSGQTPSQGSPNQAQAWNQTPSQNQSPRWASPGHDSGIGGLETPPQIVVSRPTTFHQQQPPRPASGLGLGLGLGSGDERGVEGWQWGANAADDGARDRRRRGVPEQDRQTRRHPDHEASSRRQSGASQHSLHPSQGPYSRPNHHRRGSSAESFASVPGITIEPPSRPPSIGHSRPASASRPGFLSPNHVHDSLPPQDPQPTPTVQNTSTYPIPSPLIPFQFLQNNANNSSNNTNNAHLPPGFVPNSTSPTPSPNNTFPFPVQPPTPRSPHLRLDGGGSPERQPYYPHSSPTENAVPIPIPVPTPTTPRQIYAYPSSPGPSTERHFDGQTGVGSAPHRYSAGASVNAGITPATLNRPLPGPGASNTHNYGHGNGSTTGNNTQSNTNNTTPRRNKSSLRKIPSATSLTSSTRSYSHYDPTTYLDPAYFPGEDDPLLDPATTLNTLANAASASTRLREAVSPRRAGVRLP